MIIMMMMNTVSNEFSCVSEMKKRQYDLNELLEEGGKISPLYIDPRF